MSAAAPFRPWIRMAAVKVAHGLWWLGVAVCAWVEREGEHGD